MPHIDGGISEIYTHYTGTGMSDIEISTECQLYSAVEIEIRFSNVLGGIFKTASSLTS